MSTLAAVIDLDVAIVDTPARIAQITEQCRPGNGASVLAYLQDLDTDFVLPMTRVREYAGLTADDLVGMLGGFHPPQGYTFIDRHPVLADVCDKLTSSEVIRELVVGHPVSST